MDVTVLFLFCDGGAWWLSCYSDLEKDDVGNMMEIGIKFHNFVP